MPVQPRGRACQNCQSIKIKCELGAPGGGPPPCQRCTRLNKSCVLAPPKRQKDRVAELEAKVKELTALLNAQGLQDNPREAKSRSSSGTGSDAQSDNEAVVSSQKKRKLDVSAYSSTEPSSTKDASPASSSGYNNDDPNGVCRLDGMIPVDLQQRVLDEYISSYQPLLGVVPLPQGTQASQLRVTMPNTLHAIVYIASCGILSWDMQDRINVSLIEDLTSKTIAQCKKSIDLLQALQLVCLYYRSPRNSTQIPLFQLVNIEADMAVDLGFGGYIDPPSLSIAGMTEGLRGGIRACRMWLISFIITETTALLKRRNNDQKWTVHHEHCLEYLETHEEFPADTYLRILVQHVRATHLLAVISNDMDLQTALISPVVGTQTCQDTMNDLQSQITAWKLQVPVDLWSPSLTFTGFYLETILYEPVLHTPTNKTTFSAPFLLEKLSVTDVPTPTLTPHHVNSIFALKSACHNLLDIATAFSGSLMITLPSLIYAPRVAHVAGILVKLHIAVTVPGNTYGQILRVEDIRVLDYLDKCLDMVGRGSAIDSEAVMVRIVKYAGELKKWIHQYDASRIGGANFADGQSVFNAAYFDKDQAPSNGFSNFSLSTEGTAPVAGEVANNGVSFDEFLDPNFTMEDFGLFQLFSEGDLTAATAFGP